MITNIIKVPPWSWITWPCNQQSFCEKEFSSNALWPGNSKVDVDDYLLCKMWELMPEILKVTIKVIRSAVLKTPANF